MVKKEANLVPLRRVCALVQLMEKSPETRIADTSGEIQKMRLQASTLLCPCVKLYSCKLYVFINGRQLPVTRLNSPVVVVSRSVPEPRHNDSGIC